MVERYRAGDLLRDIAADYGISHVTVFYHAKAAGATGQRKRPAKPARVIAQPEPAVVVVDEPDSLEYTSVRPPIERSVRVKINVLPPALPSRTADADQIAAFIAAKGVTRCPTAIVAPTDHASVSPEDGARLAAHYDAQAERRRFYFHTSRRR